MTRSPNAAVPSRRSLATSPAQGRVEEDERPSRPCLRPRWSTPRSCPGSPPDPLDGPPFTTVKAWAIADGRTGEVLWGHREKDPLEMASTTKIMTALIVVRLMAQGPQGRRRDGDLLRAGGPDDRARPRTSTRASGCRSASCSMACFCPRATTRPWRSASISAAGSKPPDDAPEEDDPLPRFIAEMNRVAAELGLHETHFANPNGLPGAGPPLERPRPGQAGPPRARRARFAAVVATRKRGCTVVDGQGKRRDVAWTNTNHLLEIEGYDGVKTGTTSARRHLPRGQRPSRPGPPDRRRAGRLELAGQPVSRRSQPLPLGLEDAEDTGPSTRRRHRARAAPACKTPAAIGGRHGGPADQTPPDAVARMVWKTPAIMLGQSKIPQLDRASTVALDFTRVRSRLASLQARRPAPSGSRVSRMDVPPEQRPRSGVRNELVTGLSSRSRSRDHRAARLRPFVFHWEGPATRFRCWKRPSSGRGSTMHGLCLIASSELQVRFANGRRLL